MHHVNNKVGMMPAHSALRPLATRNAASCICLSVGDYEPASPLTTRPVSSASPCDLPARYLTPRPTLTVPCDAPDALPRLPRRADCGGGRADRRAGRRGPQPHYGRRPELQGVPRLRHREARRQQSSPVSANKSTTAAKPRSPLTDLTAVCTFAKWVER